MADSATHLAKNSDTLSTHKARQLVLLGILLQALHVLFGITAIIGVLVTQSRIQSIQGSIYHSHVKWQFVTFWIALAGYAIAFYLWVELQIFWGVWIVFAVVVYRLAVSAWHWRKATAIRRWV